MNIDRLIVRIMKEEGFTPHPYWDRTQWTWGYGTKAPGANFKITPRDAEKEMWRSLIDALAGFINLFLEVPTPINEVRQECLVDMIYNLGENGVRKFKDMVEDIMDKDPNDWDEIALHAKDSLWYRQVKDRAERIVEELKTGKRKGE